MKLNNKTLALIFFALIAIYLIRKTVAKPAVKSIPDVLVQIDTSSTDKLIITPKDKSKSPVTLEKKDGQWTASNGEKTVPANQGTIRSLLTALIKIPPQQLVSKNKERWLDYELTPESSSKVECFKGGKKVDGFFVGRFNFNQTNRSATSYIRKENEDDIYSVDGFLSMSFNQDFSAFRNKQLTSSKGNDVAKLALTSNDENLILDKDISGKWITSENTELDSTKTTNYLNSLMLSSGIDFDDNFSLSGQQPVEQLVVSLNDGSSLEIDIYHDASNAAKPIVVRSSGNDAFFRSDSSGLYKKLVTDLKDLVE